MSGWAALGAALGAVTSGTQHAIEMTRNRKEAVRQREWQVDFYRNRHQWEVEDLKKAGLNPILSANQGGGVPGGAVAKVGGPDIAQSAAQMANAFAAASKMKAETKAVAQQGRKAEADAKMTEAGIPYARGAAEATRDILSHDRYIRAQQGTQSVYEKEAAFHQMSEAEARAFSAWELSWKTEVERLLLETDLTPAQIRQYVDRTYSGRKAIQIKRYLDALSPLLTIGAGAAAGAAAGRGGRGLRNKGNKVGGKNR